MNALTRGVWDGYGVKHGSYQFWEKWSVLFGVLIMRPCLRITSSTEGRFGHLPSVQFVCRKMKPQCIFYGSAPWQETYGPWFGVVCKSSQIMEEIILCSWKGYSQISQRKILKNGLLLRGQFGMLVTILCMTKSNLILWLSKMGRCLYNVISRWQRALWILPSRLDSHYKLFSQFFCSISNSFIYVLCMHLIG